MSRMSNQCQFIGNIGSDPEVRFLTNGTPVCNISIAVNDRWTDSEGKKHERTDWVRLVFWRKLAEILGKYAHKGNKIAVQGQLRTRQYEQEGVTKYTTEIEVTELELLTPKNGNGNFHEEPAPIGASDEEAPF